MPLSEPHAPDRRASSLAIGAVALMLAAVAHFHAHVAYASQLNTTNVVTPPVNDVPGAPPVVAAARRVVVLFLDGLGYDRAADLPALKALAAEGVQRPLMGEFPSFTYAAITTMETGVPSRHSGVRLTAPGPYPIWDSVSRAAARSGVAVLYDDSISSPFKDLLQLPPSARAAPVEELLQPQNARQLVWIYVGDVDRAGHRHGGDSAAYRAAALRADAVVGRAAQTLDLTKDALVVVSDHGHLDRGGHGGVEPEVLRGLLFAAGAGVGTGVLPPVSQRDLAPTLSLLLGVAAPSSSMGMPMLDLMGLGAPQDDARALAEIDAWEGAFAEDARVRLLVAVLLSLGMLAVLAWWSVQAAVVPRARDLWPVVAMIATFLVVGAALGYGFSWSLPRGNWGFNLESLAAGVLGVFVASAVSRRARAAEETVVAVAMLGVPYLLLASWVGLDETTLAGPTSSFLLLALAQLQFYSCVYLGARAVWCAVRRTGSPSTMTVRNRSARVFAPPHGLPAGVGT